MTTYTFRLEYALKLQPTCCPRTFFFFKKQEPSLLDAEFLKVRDHVLFLFLVLIGLPWCLRQLRICLQCRRPRFSPWVGKIPWRRERLPTPVYWSGQFHELYSSWGCKESDMTERLSHTHTFRPLFTVYSCLGAVTKS